MVAVSPAPTGDTRTFRSYGVPGSAGGPLFLCAVSIAFFSGQSLANREALGGGAVLLLMGPEGYGRSLQLQASGRSAPPPRASVGSL
jgi:hypothetical protein